MTKVRSGQISSACLVAIAMAVLLGSTISAQQWTPPPVTNLKVLPASTDTRALIGIMRGFTQGLGVRCQHCHVYKGENPDDLSTFDFASDDKTPKLTARTMMRMTAAITNDFLKDVGEARPAGQLKVTCYTCHRGQTKPLTERPPR